MASSATRTMFVRAQQDTLITVLSVIWIRFAWRMHSTSTAYRRRQPRAAMLESNSLELHRFHTESTLWEISGLTHTTMRGSSGTIPVALPNYTRHRMMQKTWEAREA